jgi:replicative DNA helicase
MSVPADRLPPQNVEAEQSVLGSMLIDREALATAIEILRPEDFYQDIHQIIFRSVAKLYEKSRAVDAVTLSEELRKEGQLERVGGVTYLSTLARAVPTSANVRHYAEIVEAKAMLRNLIQTSTTIVGRAYEGGDDPRNLLDQAEQMIFAIGQHRLRQPYSILKPLLVKAYERLERLYNTGAGVTGVPTDYRELDEITSGLQPSDLIILAGRPSQGKTTLAVNIARNVAVRHKLPVGMFSLEMSADQLALRFLASEGPLDAHRLRSGLLDDKDFPRIAEAMDRLSEARILIDDSPSLSILELRGRARRMKRDNDVALLVVDYLQLMRGNARSENRQQEISEISRALKALARELEVPILALSQLSRAVEGRPDRRPQLSDLRESGAIEQDADVVAFIHFPAENTPFRDWKGYEYRIGAEKRLLDVAKDGKVLQFDMPEGIDLAEIILGKQRNGPTGSVCLTFIRKTGRFGTTELYRQPPPPGH